MNLSNTSAAERSCTTTLPSQLPHTQHSHNPHSHSEHTHPTEPCTYGDTLSLQPNDNYLLLGFVNTNGLRKENWKEKNNAIRRFFRTYPFDIIGLTEINLHWPSLSPTNQWPERMQGVWESSRSNITFNTQDDSNQEWQPGGCIQISTSRTSHKHHSQGQDPSGLGRWCWTRYKGYNDIYLRVITAY